MTDWLYDPGWRTYVRWVNGVQNVVLEETVENDESFSRNLGLPTWKQVELKKDPAPGVYNGTAGARD